MIALIRNKERHDKTGNDRPVIMNVGTKRLRQDGFRSPAEAALERSRWVKSLEEGKAQRGHRVNHTQHMRVHTEHTVSQTTPAAPVTQTRRTATDEAVAAFEEVAVWVHDNGGPGDLQGQLELREKLRKLGTELGAVRVEQSSLRALWGAVLRELFPSKWVSCKQLATYVGVSEKVLRTWRDKVETLRQPGDVPVAASLHSANYCFRPI